MVVESVQVGCMTVFIPPGSFIRQSTVAGGAIITLIFTELKRRNHDDWKENHQQFLETKGVLNSDNGLIWGRALGLGAVRWKYSLLGLFHTCIQLHTVSFNIY